MTLLDRALTKAYSRRATPPRTTEDASLPAPVTRGWVARLRPPTKRSTVARAAAAAELPEFPIEVPAKIPVDEPESVFPALTVPAIPTPSPIRENTKPPTIGEPLPRELRLPSAIPAEPPRMASWAWPAICDRLLESSAGTGIRGLSSLLCEMLAERRQRSLAFTGPGRGAGRTSLLLTIARLLSEERDMRVLAIDLDFGNPQLAQFLGVEEGPDLWQAASRQAPLRNPLATLIPDRLSLAPLFHRISMTEITSERAEALRGLTQRWRREFDLVLVDGGPWELFGSLVVRESSTAEACVCVLRADKGIAGGIDGERYRQSGMDFLGFIETFADAEAQAESHRTR